MRFSWLIAFIYYTLTGRGGIQLVQPLSLMLCSFYADVIVFVSLVETVAPSVMMIAAYLLDDLVEGICTEEQYLPCC